MGTPKINRNQHIVTVTCSLREALKKLDILSVDAVLFVVDDKNCLLGSLTDGDIRRGLIKGLDVSNSILKFANPTPLFVYEDDYRGGFIEPPKERNIKIVPVVNKKGELVTVINFRLQKSILPVEAVLMAGGEGKRLRPLTEKMPKPMLNIGGKPIIEYNIDRLVQAGVKHIHISINYLGEQIQSYFNDGTQKGIQIDYGKEEKPLGTIGSVLLFKEIQTEDILIMNSDLLTNIDFLDFYKNYKQSGADMAVASTSYQVDIPYAVLETDETYRIKSLKEKPRYNYFSSAGIYIIKRNMLDLIPKNSFFDITDLIEKALELNYDIVGFPINGYWLDIGKPDDYRKAQEDIKHIKL